MNLIGRISQTAAALWILNVWFNRFSKDTGYRGGDATNTKTPKTQDVAPAATAKPQKAPKVR